MAEALLRHLAPNRYEACSAGTHPEQVHAMTVQVLSERGIPTTELWSKTIERAMEDGEVSYAFALCARAAGDCAMVPDTCCAVEPWPFDDPAGDGATPVQVERFRSARDLIEARLVRWLDEQDRRRPAGG